MTRIAAPRPVEGFECPRVVPELPGSPDSVFQSTAPPPRVPGAWGLAILPRRRFASCLTPRKDLVEPLAAGPPSIAGVPAPDPMYPFTGETLLSIRGRDWNVPGNRLPLAETRTEAAVLPRNREPRWYVPERKSARTASGGRTPQAGAAAIRAFPQLPGLGIAPQAEMELRLRVPDSLPKSEPTLVRGLPRLELPAGPPVLSTCEPAGVERRLLPVPELVAPDATEALRRAAPRIAAPGPMRAGNRTRLPASAIGADLRSALASLVVTRSAPRAPRAASQFDEALWSKFPFALRCAQLVGAGVAPAGMPNATGTASAMEACGVPDGTLQERDCAGAAFAGGPAFLADSLRIRPGALRGPETHLPVCRGGMVPDAPAFRAYSNPRRMACNLPLAAQELPVRFAPSPVSPATLEIATPVDLLRTRFEGAAPGEAQGGRSGGRSGGRLGDRLGDGLGNESGNGLGPEAAGPRGGCVRFAALPLRPLALETSTPLDWVGVPPRFRVRGIAPAACGLEAIRGASLHPAAPGIPRVSLDLLPVSLTPCAYRQSPALMQPSWNRPGHEHLAGAAPGQPMAAVDRASDMRQWDGVAAARPLLTRPAPGWEAGRITPFCETSAADRSNLQMPDSPAPMGFPDDDPDLLWLPAPRNPGLPAARASSLAEPPAIAGPGGAYVSKPVSGSPAAAPRKAAGMAAPALGRPLIHRQGKLSNARFIRNLNVVPEPLAPPPLKFPGISTAHTAQPALRLASALARFQPVLAARSFPDSSLTDLVHRLLYPEALSFQPNAGAARSPMPVWGQARLRFCGVPQPLGFRWRRDRTPWAPGAAWKSPTGQLMLPAILQPPRLSTGDPDL